MTGTGPRAIGLYGLSNGVMGDPSTTAGMRDLLVQIHVPEPGSIVLLAIGIAALAGAAAD